MEETGPKTFAQRFRIGVMRKIIKKRSGDFFFMAQKK